MPVAILRPTGAGSLTEWTPIGAATNWQAVATDVLGSIAANSAGQRDRYTFDDLPADATAVTAFAVYGDCAGDDVGGMRYTIRLSGVESNGAAFVPPDGGYVNFSTTFATAPGALAWTVARVNAIEAGPDVVDTSGTGYGVDEVWLYVEYTSSAPPAPGDAQAVDLGGGSPPVEWTSDSVVAMPPTSADLSLGENPVDLSMAGQTSPYVEMDGAGGF